MLSSEEIALLGGVNDPVSLEEIESIYLPLARLIEMLMTRAQRLRDTVDQFLGEVKSRVPFIIGVSGSVAVKKHDFGYYGVVVKSG